MSSRVKYLNDDDETVDSTPTPNRALDEAVRKLLEKAEKAEPELAAKLINTAIAWEKCKHAIVGKEEAFNPDDL